MSFNHLENLIGKSVRINRGGPDSYSGKLLSIHSDYLVLQTEQSVLYINTSHVKSVTEMPGGSYKFDDYDPEYVSADNFHSLLQELRHKFVQIHGGGPEKIEGFLAEVNDDYLMVVVKNEIVRVPTFHIKSVSVSTKSNKSSSNRSGSNRSGGSGSGGDKSGNKSGSKSGGNRSGGGHSGGGGSGGDRSGNRSHRSDGSRGDRKEHRSSDHKSRQNKNKRRRSNRRRSGNTGKRRTSGSR
jgi:spore coat protein B